MEPTQITDEAALEAALSVPSFLLFKHSRICPTSAQAFNEYRHFLETFPDTPTAWIDVRASRPLSLAVAERTGVTHESPQALLLRGGEAVWNASHHAITRESLEDALHGAG
jgi:bacillithiol system protein YtxJ